MVKLTVSSVLLALAVAAFGQQPEWAQCGGMGWTGGTTCVSGTVCTAMNAYYSQCVPGTATAAPATGSPAPATSSTAPASTGTPVASGTGLNTLAVAAGKLYFGTATDNSELSDTAYTAILDQKGMFGQLTPANACKWQSTEATQNQFTLSQCEQILTLAQSNGQIMRAHNLVWHQQLPSWVSSGTFSTAQLTSIIQNHISGVAGGLAGKVYCWDVVNEPFNDDGTFRSDVFFNTLGQSYITIALNAARAADPKAKLYINDYNIEGTGAKATAMLNLVKSLKSAGTPIDGIGFESHFIVGEVPTTIATNMQQFTAAGVEVAITELDIRMTLPATQALLTQQETDFKNVVSACVSTTGCVGVTLWDFTDKYSWVPNTFSGQGEACPWDANLQPKPALTGIQQALS